MRGKIAARFAPALAACVMAGCAQTAPMETGSVPAANSAPYHPETNPACGALGNCQPLITQPYAISPNR